MREHPIYGRWYKMLADGKPRSEVVAELEKDSFNPALLDVGADNPVPEDMPAATVAAKDWEFLCKYAKMMKVGLPRPVVEHKMMSEVSPHDQPLARLHRPLLQQHRPCCSYR